MKTAYIPMNEQALERVKDAVDFKAIQIADEGELLYKKMFYQNGICFEPAYREYVNYRVSVKVNEPKKERLVCDEIKELEKKVEDLEIQRTTQCLKSLKQIQEMKDTIESQNEVIARLKSEIEDRVDCVTQVQWQDCLERNTKLESELELKTEVALEWERKFKEANKENLYLKRSFVQDGSAPLEKCIEQARQLQNLDRKIVELKAELKEADFLSEKLEEQLEEAKKGGSQIVTSYRCSKL